MQLSRFGRTIAIVQETAVGGPVMTVLDTYDDSDRLTGQQTSGALATFTMDGVGNVTMKSHEGSLPVTLAYDAANRLTTVQDGPTRVTYTYDNNGNLTNENRGGVNSVYTYDYENRQVSAPDGAGVAVTSTYAWDGLRKVKQAVESGTSKTTTYVWDGADYLGEVKS